MSARHARNPNSRANQARARIATEAARLVVEQGLDDYRQAKRKAVESLRLGDDVPLPGNDEIELAVLEYQRLFRADSQPGALAELRRVALEVMRSLEQFSPKLVGPVLSGTADELSRVTLHLFADPPESVQWALMERRVRFETGERRLPMSSGEIERVPTYDVSVNGVDVELVVFSERLRRQRPLGARDGKPLERAGVARVAALLEESSAG